MEMILKEYEDSEFGKENIELYLTLYKEETEMAKRRKQLLVDLKENFKEEFMPIIEMKYPGYFI